MGIVVLVLLIKGAADMWTSFLVGFTAGLAATPHCLGMCGGFPLHLAKGSHKGRILLRQILFVTGKAFTYMFLGALAAALGVVLLKDTKVASFAPVLRLLAGLITVFLGLLMMGFKLPSIKALQGISDAGFVRSLFGGILDSPTPLSSFVLGLGVGFLPCPLPMGMMAAAAASHSITQGIVLMAGVGLGTAPGLIAVGIFGVGLNRKFTRYGMKLAGVMVLAVGLLTLGRVTGVISKPTGTQHAVPSCCGGTNHK